MDSTSRHGGPSAPGELVGTVVASSGDDGGYERLRMVATNGGVEWRRMVVASGGDKGGSELLRMVATNGDHEWKVPSGIFVALCQRTDRQFICFTRLTARESSQIQYRTRVMRIRCMLRS